MPKQKRWQKGVDKSGESGIINVTKKFAGYKQTLPNFDDYPITENLQAVEIIKERTGMTFPKFSAAEVIDGDACCIAGYKPAENRLYVSSKFFNSKQALIYTLKEWAKNGIIPKQATSIRYLAEHETAHIRIPDSFLKSEEAIKIWRKRNLLNENDTDVFDFFADSTAIYKLNPKNKDNNIVKAVEYLRSGGITI